MGLLLVELVIGRYFIFLFDVKELEVSFGWFVVDGVDGEFYSVFLRFRFFGCFISGYGMDS